MIVVTYSNGNWEFKPILLNIPITMSINTTFPGEIQFFHYQNNIFNNITINKYNFYIVLQELPDSRD